MNTTDHCRPFDYPSLTRCNYVIRLEEECEGGGYVLWTRFVVCQEADIVEGLVIALGVAVLAYLFLALSTVADEFFSRSISAIVDHLRISQNIAGVTFMAFGNGAPDIFSTIVSMVSTETPRANLAIGQMLGGGMFVTTCVVASIVLTNPFKVMRRPILRDLLFYIVALGIMASVLVTGKLQVWQPAAFLGLYLLYASTVILGKVWSHRREKRKVHIGVQDVEATRIDKQKSASFHGYSKERPATLDLKATTSFPLGKSTTGSSLAVPTYPLDRSRAASLAASDLHRHCSIRRLSNNITIVPVGGSTPHHHTYLTHGKFFTDDDEGEDETVVETAEVSPAGERAFSTISEELQVVTDMDDSSNECPSKADVSPTDSNHTDSTDCNLRDTSGYFGFIQCLLHHFALWTPKEMEEMPWASRIIAILQWPLLVILKLTIPRSEDPWCKLMASFHVALSPTFVVLAFHRYDLAPVPGGPGLYAYTFVVSAILLVALWVFTGPEEPRFYKNIATYTGFVISTAWIYAIASEVVGIVLMLGVVSGISNAILGLTVLAWSNSIGDLVADVSVARKGYSRMAISAAIGGPLFNMLIGFGVSFLIVTLRGKPVPVDVDAVEVVMVCFLALSMASSIVILVVQKFHAGRFYAIFLLVLYVVFLVVAIVFDVTDVINI